MTAGGLIGVYPYAVEVEHLYRNGAQVRRRYCQTEAEARAKFALAVKASNAISVAVFGPLNTPVDDDPVVCRWNRAGQDAASG